MTPTLETLERRDAPADFSTVVLTELVFVPPPPPPPSIFSQPPTPSILPIPLPGMKPPETLKLNLPELLPPPAESKL